MFASPKTFATIASNISGGGGGGHRSLAGPWKIGFGNLRASDSFGTFLDSSIGPLLQACENSSQALAQLASGTQDHKAPQQANAPHIFLINCMLAIWSPLSLHRSCSQRVAQLRQKIDSKVLHLPWEVTIHLRGMPWCIFFLVFGSTENCTRRFVGRTHNWHISTVQETVRVRSLWLVSHKSTFHLLNHLRFQRHNHPGCEQAGEEQILNWLCNVL